MEVDWNKSQIVISIKEKVEVVYSPNTQETQFHKISQSGARRKEPTNAKSFEAGVLSQRIAIYLGNTM